MPAVGSVVSMIDRVVALVLPMSGGKAVPQAEAETGLQVAAAERYEARVTGPLHPQTVQAIRNRASSGNPARRKVRLSA